MNEWLTRHVDLVDCTMQGLKSKVSVQFQFYGKPQRHSRLRYSETPASAAAD